MSNLTEDQRIEVTLIALAELASLIADMQAAEPIDPSDLFERLQQRQIEVGRYAAGRADVRARAQAAAYDRGVQVPPMPTSVLILPAESPAPESDPTIRYLRQDLQRMDRSGAIDLATWPAARRLVQRSTEPQQ